MQLPAVDGGARRRQHLHRRDRYRLAEADARHDPRALPCCSGITMPLGLARNVHAGRLIRCRKHRQVIIEALNAQPQAHFHKYGIAGILQRLCKASPRRAACPSSERGRRPRESSPSSKSPRDGVRPRPASSAEAAVSILNVEPGSYASVTQRLRIISVSAETSLRGGSFRS